MSNMTRKLRLAAFAILSALIAVPTTTLVAQAPPAGASKIIATPIEGKNPDEMVGPIVMGNMPMAQVLDLLRDYSGRVILPAGIPATKLNFNSGGKLKRTDAIFALENLLSLNGVMLLELENGMIRAIPTAHAHRGTPPLIDTIPENADSTQIFTKIWKLTYFDSTTAYYRVRNFVTPGFTVDHVPETNSLIVTDRLTNIKRIDEIVQKIDQAPDVRLELYTFPIVHASAWHIRGLYYQIYRSSVNQRLRGSLVYADSRGNTLMVVTHKSNYEFFENFIKELDKEVAPFTTTEVIKVEQGNYWSIWSTLHGIVRHQQHQFRARGFINAEERDQGDGSVSSLTVAGELTTIPTDQAPPEAAQSVPAAEVAQPGSDPGAVMVDGESPELQFSPYIGLYADPSNHAYVVYGTQSDIARARAIVKMLDIKSPPYVTNEVFQITHARATDIRNVINYLIWAQRSAFGRAQIQSGQERAQSPETPPTFDQANAEQGFEYSSFVATIADNRNNTLLVQGTQGDINQLKALVEKLDVESAPLTSNKVVYLKHAQAQTLARVIQNIINYQRWMFSRTRAMTQTGAEGGMDTPQLGFEFSDYAVVNADRRTNALFVYGTQRDIARVEEVIAETDIPVEPMTTTKVFPLIHTDASQTASLINNIVWRQIRALSAVRSQSRATPNPTTPEGAMPPEAPTGIVEGEEALQFSSFISITSDRRSNSLIVYGTNSDVTQVEKLVAQVDIEVAPITTSKVFLLQNTQARTLWGVLNSVIRGQERALRSVRSRIQQIRNVRPDDAEAIATDTTLEALQFSPYVSITPNSRNNSLIVYGTQSDITQLEELIKISDVEIAPKTRSRTFFVRHADANDVARTITNLIRQQQRVRERERTVTRIFRREMGEDGMPAGDPGSEENVSDFMEDGGGEIMSETSSQSYSDLFSFDEDLQFSPYVSLVADDRSNSVLAYGTEFDLEQVSSLIEQIDDVLPQVRIEVVIAEVILSDGQISGLDSFGISYNVTSPNQTSIAASSPTLNGEEAPGFGSSFSINDFSLNTVFGVAKSNDRVKVLSAPAITTTHNRQASINVGESRPIITGSTTNNNTNNLITSSTVEFRDIGINLRVRPLVSENGFIQLDLEQTVETVIDTQTIDGNIQPIIGTRKASSFVSVRDEEVIVMGGLQAVDSSNSDEEVFVLGKVPVFGSLFRPRSTSSTVRELILFIRPKIVESVAESELMTQNKLDNSSVGDDVDAYFKSGEFIEHREARELIEAEEAKKEGKEKQPSPAVEETNAATEENELIEAVRETEEVAEG